jgi:Tol biopolymer transport system component
MLSLPSPQFLGIPAGQAAQDEFARMVGARIVQALVFETANRRLDLSNFPPRVLLQWELSKAGLDGPFITAEMTRTLAGILQAGTWPPLGSLSLRARSSAAAAPTASVEDAALIASAFAFLERQFGPGAVERLIPAMQSNATLGEAINTVWKINAASLEPARVAFWRRQVGLPAVQAPPPSGDLALLCAPTRNTTAILRGRADGTGYFSTLEGPGLSLPMWSPTGDKLAYLQGRQVAVLDVTALQTKTLGLDYAVGAFNWLPDGRLLLNRSGASRNSNYVFDLATSALIQITGTGHVWSPDGQRVASLGLLSREAFPSAPASQNNIAIWVADAEGREDKPIALGFSPVWSPDSRQLAFVNALSFGPGNFVAAGEIRIADATGDAIRTLARVTDLVESAQGASWLGNMAWSPDGAWLAVTVNRSSGATIFVLEAETGRTRVTWRGAAARWMSLAWSPDSRYVGFWTVPATSRDTTVGIVGALDAATGQAATIAGRDFDWSPDGQWLAIPQDPTGALLVAPDLSAMRWLDLPNCSTVAWRPGKRD